MESARCNYVRKVRWSGGTRWAFSYIGPDGRRHQETTRASSHRAAERLLDQKLRELDRQREVGIQPITFSEFSKKYLLHQKSAIEPSSYERVRGIIEGQLVPVFGKRRLSDIRLRDVQEYVNKRAQTVYRRQSGIEKKIAPSTVERELETLSGIFSRAMDWDYLLANPTRKVKLRKYEWRKQRILDRPEEKRLFGAFEMGDRRRYLAGIVTVALHTGMREDAILRLRWADIDFGGKTVTVRSTNERPTKGKRTRAIAMSRKVEKILADLHMEALKETQGTPITIRERYLFVNPWTGTRYVATNVAWHAALKDAGITGLRFHDLRHTFATRAIQGGCKLPALQQVLGHRDITTTMRYVHMLGVDHSGVIGCVESFEKKGGGLSASVEAGLA